MSKVKARAKVPKEASIGELIEVKTLLRHPMHSGRMKDSEGNVIKCHWLKDSEGMKKEEIFQR